MSYARAVVGAFLNDDQILANAERVLREAQQKQHVGGQILRGNRFDDGRLELWHASTTPDWRQCFRGSGCE